MGHLQTVKRENKEAVFKTIDRGVKIVLASGRPVIGIRRVAKELKLYVTRADI